MNTIRSHFRAGAVSELKDILGMVSDPKKAKESLGALEESYKKTMDSQEALAKKEKDIESREAKLSIETVAVETATQMLKDREKKQIEFKSVLEAKSTSLTQREKDLASEKKGFDDFKEKALKELEAKKEALDKSLKMASDERAKAEAKSKEYETKIQKLKMVMG